jgi:hypothetical protein
VVGWLSGLKHRSQEAANVNHAFRGFEPRPHRQMVDNKQTPVSQPGFVVSHRLQSAANVNHAMILACPPTSYNKAKIKSRRANFCQASLQTHID